VRESGCVVDDDLGSALPLLAQHSRSNTEAGLLPWKGGALAGSASHDRRSIAAVSDVERFGFAFSRAYRVSARAFGITPATAWVDVGDEALDVRFGPWRLSTPLANVTDVAVTGPYAFWKTAGPARLAITDRGLTFATNGDRGVLISFRTPVRGLDPLGVLRHPELTVTVAEVRRLADLLRSSHGEAPRRRSSKRSTM
jgi:hypothetical protein